MVRINCSAPGLAGVVFRIALAGLIGGAVVSVAHAAEKKSLYFVVNGASDFWKAAEAGVKKAQGELPNYTMQLKYPEQSSAAIQNRLMDDLLAGGAAGIMVSAVDPKTQIDELNKVGAQTVLFTTDSDAPNSKRVAYIGSSNIEAGKQAGDCPGGRHQHAVLLNIDRGELPIYQTRKWRLRR